MALVASVVDEMAMVAAAADMVVVVVVAEMALGGCAGPGCIS